MVDRPIIFSAPMVRALLDGRKTQTRRLVHNMPAPPEHDSVVHANPKHDHPYFDAYCGKKRTPANPRGMSDYWCWWTRDDREGRGCRIRYVPGDRLYVREGYRPFPPDDKKHPNRWGLAYAATGGVDRFAEAPADFNPTLYNYERWTPSIHMPRWASRLTLIVADVRVEQLQAISNADARAEGVQREPTKLGAWEDYTKRTSGAMSAKESFATLWQSLHGLDSWAANPFVVALTFRVEHGNIDRIGS